MFKEPLQQILENTDGSLGVLIMGTDGIAVEKVLQPEANEANLDVAAAEFTSLVRSAQRTSNDMQLGKLNELVISCENVNVIIRLFSQEYFIVLALGPDGNIGRGRYELRKAELRLAREFAL